MDWTSEEGRALLRKAWPDGYLAKRGVRTVGGFEVAGEGVKGATDLFFIRDVFALECISVSLVQGGTHADLRDRGDLLPLPDPEDTATWACLLQDLWEAAAVHRSNVGPLRGLAWIGHASRHEARRWWLLMGYFDNADTAGISAVTALVDPAEALVSLRVALRAEGA